MIRMEHEPSMAANSVVTKAAIRAADRLGLSARALSEVIGVSEASVSRMKRGEYLLPEAGKSFELAVLLIRAFRALDAITGGDERALAAWVGSPNLALGGVPRDRMMTVGGLADVVAYLDARRAPL
ncbi:MAG: DUF2384 domain-containing protein [Zavarzinia sp.]|nr:DUF2384 domain-containing protein [Zavarzinia sp.]